MRTNNPLYVPTNISRAPKPRLDRPARVQETDKKKETHDNVTGEYNIWYHRYLGFDQKKPKPTTRLNVEEDTGMTTAPLESTVCLNFARGGCQKGYKCNYKHQIPTEDDELRVSMIKDVFGRARHGTDREDMDGVGSFNHNNRTLYLGSVACKDDVRETEKLIKKDFGQFGELEYVRAIPTKAIAFVRYKLRVAAEFAKEAMEGQTTPYGEISVRWAHVDPNPLAKEFDKRADEALAQYAIAKRLLEMSPQQREAWNQQNMVAQGVYPTSAPAAPVQQVAVAPPPGSEGVGGTPALPPGVDPSRAAQIAEYWANFHAQKAAEQLGIQLPAPPAQQLTQQEPKQKKHKEDSSAQGEAAAPAEGALVNPHTGEVVENDFAVNPFSQAPHPYAYRDYGWNRPKKQTDAEAEKKKKRREAREAIESQQGDYDAQSDPNYSYGPQAAQREKRAMQKASEDRPVVPGRPRQQGQQHQNQQRGVLLPGARGKAVIATQQEEEALANDEPLVFGK